jgi:adenine-specific DNA-methyltransferase
MEGWKPEDVIYEVLLREGYSLTSQIERVAEITTVSIWQVIDDVKGQYFFICLEDVVSLEMIRRLNLSRDDLFICRDRALDDTTTANLALQCRLKVI